MDKKSMNTKSPECVFGVFASTPDNSELFTATPVAVKSSAR